MTILDKIVIKKREEILLSKEHVSEAQLRDMELFNRSCYSLKDSFSQPERNGIIAEFKRASPSKGVINAHSSVQDVVTGYQNAGVSAVSVLTDHSFFGGNMEDLVEARKHLQIPILRKEFILEEYQITESKAFGADIILLIASILEPPRLESLADYAKSLGLNVLLEVHNAEELAANCFKSIDAIGVNNRNLHDFSVSLDHSLNLVNAIPNEYIKVSESGISDPITINALKSAGFQGFLIGENFMKTENPTQAIQDFTAALQ